MTAKEFYEFLIKNGINEPGKLRNNRISMVRNGLMPNYKIHVKAKEMAFAIFTYAVCPSSIQDKMNFWIKNLIILEHENEQIREPTVIMRLEAMLNDSKFASTISHVNIDRKFGTGLVFFKNGKIERLNSKMISNKELEKVIQSYEVRSSVIITGKFIQELAKEIEITTKNKKSFSNVTENRKTIF